MTGRTSYTTTGNAADGYTVTKDGTSNWNPGPYTAAISGDFIARYRPTAAQSGAFGVDATGVVGGASYNDYGFEFDSSNAVQVKQNTVYDGASFGTHAGLYFFVRRVGSTVTVLSGATTDIAAATVRGTYTNSAPLYVNLVIFTAAGSGELRVTA